MFYLVGCGGGGSNGQSPDAPLPDKTIHLKADFNEGIVGWNGGYADYTVGTAPNDVIWEFKTLPTPLLGSGYYLSGTNKSDDLFIYIKRKFTGFDPNSHYQATFEVKLGTNVPSGCSGVGGAPGEGVTIFAGASRTEPETVLLTDGNFRVNIDRGNQGTSGKEALVLGNIANTTPNCSEWSYQSKTLANSLPLDVISNENGEMWVLVGMDSGFESFSQIYLQSIFASFAPQK